MNYVVVDFEWNQNPYGRSNDNPKLPFEIIEIGAVMLDEDLNEIDRFSETIRPKVYKRLHYMTRELTGITQEELQRSEPFPYVLMDFMYWCGDEFTFCTWGNTDMLELQRNMHYYHLDDLLEGPVTYYNIQKMFRTLHEDHEGGSSLESAVEYFGIEKDAGFHRAISDAIYTARVFKKLDFDKAVKLFSVDYYQNPKCKEDEIHLLYDDHYKFISREFNSKEEMMCDREVKAAKCFLCGKPVRKKLHWFVGKTRNYYCLAQCPTHGYIRGKIRVKKTEDDKVYAVKTLRLVDEETAVSLRRMKLEVIAKRKERRHKSSGSAADITEE